MKHLPWQNPRLDIDSRRDLLEQAYDAFVTNPFYELLIREAEERARTGIRLLTNPEFTGEKLKFYQGEMQAWSDVPGLSRHIYSSEDSLIEFDSRNSDETEQMPGT